MDLVNLAFEEIVQLYKERFIPSMSSYYNNELFIQIQSYINKGAEQEIVFADEVMAKYICDMFSKTNKDYFIFITKFVILFREGVNSIKRDENGEYTKVSNADSLPDCCNNFVVEFMEKYDYFNMDDEELISIIQHFCLWMFENRYTSSRLTLMDN
jgi:hypothetical protein